MLVVPMSGTKCARRIGAARRASADYTSLFSAIDFDIDSISGLKAEPTGEDACGSESMKDNQIVLHQVQALPKDQAFERELYLFVIRVEGVDESDHRKDEAWVEAQLGEQKANSQGYIKGGEIDFDASFMFVFRELPCTISLQIQGPGGSYGPSGELIVTMEMFLTQDVQEFFVPILDNARILVGVRFDALQKEVYKQKVLKLERERMATTKRSHFPSPAPQLSSTPQVSPFASVLTELKTHENHAHFPHKLKRNAHPAGSPVTIGPCARRKSIDVGLPIAKSLVPASSVGTDAAREDEWEIGKRFEIVPGRLSFVSHFSGQETMIETFHDKDILHYVRSSLHEKYTPVHADFGPVDLSVVCRFCELLRAKRTSKKLEDKHLVYVTDDVAEHRTNAAFLICSYLVLEEGFSPQKAWEPFSKIRPSPFVPFRDASETPALYTLGVLDILKALTRAVALGWYNNSTFDVMQYEKLAKRDISRICPKVLLFSDPGRKRGDEDWDDLTDLLKKNGVTLVIRANCESKYSPRQFQERDMRFLDCRFEARQTPCDETVKLFLSALAEEQGAVGIHCQTGRNRSGTLTALWMMREHKWSPNEAMAWIRLVKPGSIVGQQQNFIKECWARGFDGNALVTRLFLGGRSKSSLSRSKSSLSFRTAHSSLSPAARFDLQRSRSDELPMPGPLVEEEERESQEGGGGQNAAGVSMTAARARRSSLPEVREGMQIGRSGSRLGLNAAQAKGERAEAQASQRRDRKSVV